MPRKNTFGKKKKTLKALIFLPFKKAQNSVFEKLENEVFLFYLFINKSSTFMIESFLAINGHRFSFLVFLWM